MEIKIGVQHAPRELVVDTPSSQDEVQEAVSKALGDGSPLQVTDQRGRLIVVPGDRIAYVEIGGGNVGSVGFR